ncbi:protein lifeguard 1-like [Convolutriloba macropyga]|uniref:protein lifeguard 1-like n=1 Tax=Convolutriloba macropyga TaxID=536237 RepID=UPI003F51CAB3
METNGNNDTKPEESRPNRPNRSSAPNQVVAFGRDLESGEEPPPYPIDTKPKKRRCGRCGQPGDENGKRDLFNSDFNERKIRQRFVRKVYLTLTWQLILTSGIVCTFMFVKPIKEFFIEYWWMSFVFLGCMMIFYLILMCAKKVRRKFPANLILLIIFTLLFGSFLGVIACSEDTDIVLFALGITVVVVIAVSLFACQAKVDFTSWIGVMFVISLVFFAFGILMIFFYNRILTIVYGCIGALIFTVYLAIDTQIVMGGKRYELNEEDWIQGAIILYMDICYIFMYIMIAAGAIKG